MTALTIRISGDCGWLSSDDGRTWCLDASTVKQVVEIASAAGGSDAIPMKPGDLTAGIRAVLGEAKRSEPRMDVDPSDYGDEPSVEGSKVIGTDLLIESHPLREVLENRTSERRLRPPTLRQLATLLVRTGRVRSWQETENGGQKVSRPLPSAGGCNPIELQVVTTDIQDLPSGWWVFDPLSCRLLPVESEADPVKHVRDLVADRGFEIVGGCTVVFAVARLRRTLERYPAGGTLVWLDAGVTLAGLHLAASDIGLGSCIIAGTGVLPSEQSDVVDIGGIVVGQLAS